MNFDNYIDLPEATPLALTVKKSVAPSFLLQLQTWLRKLLLKRSFTAGCSIIYTRCRSTQGITRKTYVRYGYLFHITLGLFSAIQVLYATFCKLLSLFQTFFRNFVFLKFFLKNSESWTPSVFLLFLWFVISLLFQIQLETTFVHWLTDHDVNK